MKLLAGFVSDYKQIVQLIKRVDADERETSHLQRAKVILSKVGNLLTECFFGEKVDRSTVGVGVNELELEAGLVAGQT